MIPAERADRDARWLRAFHAGRRDVIEACYREHFAKVVAAAARVLRDVDAETVAHEVFYRLLTDAEMRATFHGGNLGGWLSVVAHRAAIDHLRRLRREAEPLDDAARADDARASDEVEAKMLVERFRREVLPEKYAALFELRFLRQLPQREAARELGMHRTTLVYQEQRIRELLERFLLGGGDR